MHTMYCESKSELNLKAYTYTIVFSCTMTMNVSWKVLSLLTSLLCSLSLTVAVNQGEEISNIMCAFVLILDNLSYRTHKYNIEETLLGFQVL